MSDEPAFPHSHTTFSPKIGKLSVAHDGMTLRDYFAAQALSALIARGQTADARLLAGGAYILAEAMLHEREKYKQNV